MLLVDFDRYTVLTNPDVIDFAGQTVLAMVEGWILVDTGSVTYRREFSGSDLVEIVAPGSRR